METCVLPVLPKIFKHELTELNIKTPGVEKLLQKINTPKAIGPDNISNMILKNCVKQLSPENQDKVPMLYWLPKLHKII